MTVADYLTRCGGQLTPAPVVTGGLPTATALGLTVRDYLAGQALAGITRTVAAELTAPARDGIHAWWAAQAYALADAMLAERAKVLPPAPKEG